MPGTNDNKEIGRKRPCDSSNDRQQGLESHSTHENVKSKQKDKHIHHNMRQAQVIEVTQMIQYRPWAVARRYLVCRHTAKQCICPTGHFTRPVKMLSYLMARTYGSGIILARQNQTLWYRCREISERQKNKENNCGNFLPYLFNNLFHKCHLYLILWQRYRINCYLSGKNQRKHSLLKNSHNVPYPFLLVFVPLQSI